MEQPANLHVWIQRLGGGKSGAQVNETEIPGRIISIDMTTFPPVLTPPAIEQMPWVRRLTERQTVIARGLIASALSEEGSSC